MFGRKFSYNDVEKGEGTGILVGDVIIRFAHLESKKPEITIASPEMVKNIEDGTTVSDPIEIDEELVKACEMFEEANARYALAKHYVAEVASLTISFCSFLG